VRETFCPAKDYQGCGSGCRRQRNALSTLQLLIVLYLDLRVQDDVIAYDGNHFIGVIVWAERLMPSTRTAAKTAIFLNLFILIRLAK